MLQPIGTDRLPRRLLQLYAGLVLYGVSMALMVRSSLGVMPWDVLHQGLSRQLGWSLGVVTMVVGAAVLLAWVPLRERPGLGTLSNIVVIGLAVDGALAVIPVPAGLVGRVVFGMLGIVLNGVATAAYIGVQLGPGPRDGLMTGWCGAPAARCGSSARPSRSRWSPPAGCWAAPWGSSPCSTRSRSDRSSTCCCQGSRSPRPNGLAADR
jgi:hypothetical protein